MKILINTDLTPNQRQRIESVSDQIHVTQPQGQAELLLDASDSDVIFGDFNKTLFDTCSKLKWVQVLGSGVDGSLFPEFVESQVILTSAKGFVGTHLADQTWALLLGLLRGIGRAVRERTWDNRMSIRHATWELSGRTLGIVGMGGTGLEVARRASGFEMEIIAVDPETVATPSFVKSVRNMEGFYDLLAESDIVSVSYTHLTLPTSDLV